MNLTSSYEISRKMAAMFMVMTATLVVINVLLVSQNKKLKSSVERSGRSMEIQPGTQLPAITGMDPDGNRLVFDYGRDPRKTLLLVFSPSCRFCKDNMPKWEAILGSIDKTTYRVAGVSLFAEGLKEYLAQYGLSDLPIIAEMDPEARVAYNLVVSPQTILISPEGKAEKVWTGVIDGEKRADLERMLNIRPTLIEALNPADGGSVVRKQDGPAS